MTKHFKDFTGASASITVHKDGTATLKIFCAGKRTTKKYNSYKSAYAAWYRFTN